MRALMLVKAQWEKGWLEDGSFQWSSDSGKNISLATTSGSSCPRLSDRVTLPRRKQARQIEIISLMINLCITPDLLSNSDTENITLFLIRQEYLWAMGKLYCHPFARK